MELEYRNFEISSPDGAKLFAQSWQPPTPTKAVVCLVHGLGEHSGRYGHVAERLVRSDYALLAFDLRGHGRTEGQRGHTPSFQSFMDDIETLLNTAAERYPGLPRFLYGHSLGGLLVLNYMLRRQPEITGVITTGAGLRSPVLEQRLKVALANILGSILPKATLPTGLDPEGLSRSPDVVESYKQDPLVHDRSSFAMAKETIASVGYVWENAEKFPDVPLLMMHGSADKNAYPSSSTDFAAKVPGKVTVKMWDGLYHEIHNEPEQDRVLGYMIDWIDSHLGGV